ncbi:SDR family oxidoreductase [Sphaerisporangium rubeum]|uniref:NAD(P)-dependent dehydrogenase (Short-subunit alcohol dehydrogenase family) n=1 Tax=Sphaerisporangium rubeum TaxID=321317 RepID=A0A7X0M5I5_9ACTN|nr:SDR family oxidoreductase [Sphaerisporangium rubeum]MBB6472232.1 NAD(P)-dependent dehydrogenase (short-subunit alcohol dehydrogenase family) [Sphaerisporangium rubeum]
MKIANSVAFVTGANRGIGRHIAAQLVERGAAKVYAAARVPERVDIDGVEAVRVDVTDPESVAAAAATAGDVTLLVNNAGVLTGANLVTGDMDQIRLEMDTHFYGTLSVVRAFAPVLKANRPGAIVNILSALSWFSYDGANAYAAAKAAAWSLTNGVRLELAGQGTQVTGVHLGVADTDMSRGQEGEKMDPALVARAALDGVEAGSLEVVADDWSAMIKATLADDPARFYGPALR